MSLAGPDNPVQLVTQIQVAPYNREDADLLAESLPGLKARTEVEHLYVYGGFGSPEVDQACLEQSVELVPTDCQRQGLLPQAVEHSSPQD